MTARSTWVRLLRLALLPYFAWEMLQAPAFTGMSPGWWVATAVCALASIGDGVIVLAVFAIGALLFRDWRWSAPPRACRDVAPRSQREARSASGFVNEASPRMTSTNAHQNWTLAMSA